MASAWMAVETGWSDMIPPISGGGGWLRVVDGRGRRPPPPGDGRRPDVSDRDGVGFLPVEQDPVGVREDRGEQGRVGQAGLRVGLVAVESHLRLVVGDEPLLL